MSSCELASKMDGWIGHQPWSSLFTSLPYDSKNLGPSLVTSPVASGGYALTKSSSSHISCWWMRIGLSVFFFDRRCLVGYSTGQVVYVCSNGSDDVARRCLACIYFWSRHVELPFFGAPSSTFRELLVKEVEAGGLMCKGLGQLVHHRMGELNRKLAEEARSYQRFREVKEKEESTGVVTAL